MFKLLKLRVFVNLASVSWGYIYCSIFSFYAQILCANSAFYIKLILYTAPKIMLYRLYVLNN